MKRLFAAAVLVVIMPLAAAHAQGVEGMRSAMFSVGTGVSLAGNAIKFTPEGGTVTLCARPRDGALWITIADTGRGIAPEDLAHIFDRYWRPKGSEGEGTGLGLYIARGIVEAHGGRVWAESSPQGATFVFTLPLEQHRD